MRVEHWRYRLPLALRTLFRGSLAEQQLRDELEYHVDQLTAQLGSRGLSPAQARTEALRAMGGIERRKEEMRNVRTTAGLENVVRDVRHALRALLRTPAFSVIAIATLALGTGANAAIFTVIDTVILQPLGYGHPDRLVVVDHRSSDASVPAELFAWQRDSLRSFDRIGAAVFHQVALTGRGDPEQLNSLQLTADIFPLLQVQPLIGRYFTADETRGGHATVVVLSHDFWTRRFAGDRNAIGQHLTLDGVSRTVIGVMPKEFRFAPYWATRADLWMPMSLDGAENDWDTAALRVFARMRPGVTVASAQAEMTAAAARLHRTHPQSDERVVVEALQDKVTGPVRSELWLLFAAVALVLLIACANVMHLQLMRSISRERESAVRLSLGATSRRLVQQSMVESLVLSLVGGTFGLLIAALGIRVLVGLAPSYIPRIDAIHVNAAVFGFMLLVAITTGLVSGLIPALAASRVDANQMLRAAGRGSSESAQRRRLGALLVVSEFAMAVILLIGAGLVLRSFAAMIGVRSGFDPRNVISMQVSLRGTQHADPVRRSSFFAQLTDEIRVLPGVVSVGAINHLPLHGDSWGFSIWVADQPGATRDNQPHGYFRLVRPGYFNAMKIPLTEGRDFTEPDVTNRSQSVVIDQALALQIWPHEDPLGKRISITDPEQGANWYTVIGVAVNVQQSNWSPNRQGEMYFPYHRSDGTAANGDFENLLDQAAMTFVVRTRDGATGVANAVRRVVSKLDADAPVSDVISMQQAQAEQLAEPEFYLVLLGGFAIVALVLAAVGVYGVLSFAVTSRTRELGIRMALGAPRNTPFRLAFAQGLRLALAGSVAGMVGALLLTRYLSVLLFGVTPLDSATFAIAPLVLSIVAALACYFPARRAARVDPVIALRQE